MGFGVEDTFGIEFTVGCVASKVVGRRRRRSGGRTVGRLVLLLLLAAECAQ